MTEIWKDIEGYEGCYQVSSLGNVRSLDREIIYSNGSVRIQKGVPIKPHFTNDGYSRLGLQKRARRVAFPVHRLVALAFIENPENKLQVNHINGVKTDNRAENLEWNTPKENSHHSHKVLKIKRPGCSNSSPKLSPEDVISIRKVYIHGDWDYGARALGKKFNVSRKTISKIINNETHKDI